MKTLAAVAMLLMAACATSRPVDYRLPGRVSGPVTKDASARFAGLFCVDLESSWGPCGQYLEASPVAAVVPSISGVRVLLVGGLFGDCLAQLGVHVFQDAARALVAAGVRVDTVPPLEDVAAFVVDHPGEPPYIAIGYSKGAGDLMDALTSYPTLPIRALVTVAGSVGGSRLADQFPGGLPAVPGCNASAVTQITRANRFAALQRYHSAVPAFSLVAVADTTRVSSALRPFWDFLRTFSLDQDSQVIAEEGIVPGATYLGVALADHWAIALPFDEVVDPVARAAVARVVDHNRFPRAALLTAIVQFVVAEIERTGT